MGQRSQIYVFYNGKLQIANHYQFNYGMNMVSRARYGLEYLKDNSKYLYTLEYAYLSEGFRRHFDLNVDLRNYCHSDNLLEILNDDIEYMKDNKEAYREYFENEERMNEYCRYSVFDIENDDGCLFISIEENDESVDIKFCLTNDKKEVLSVEKYLDWDTNFSWKDKEYNDSLYGFQYDKITLGNIKSLKKFETITQDELGILIDSFSYEEDKYSLERSI